MQQASGEGNSTTSAATRNSGRKSEFDSVWSIHSLDLENRERERHYIQGQGTVPASRSRSVVPSMCTMYTLVAKGPGGTDDASARVTVNPVPAVKVVAPQPSEADLFVKNMKDLFFDFSKADVRPDEVPATNNDAEFLDQHPDIKIMVEGHCDDRGSEEYNIAFGVNRANALKQSLEHGGVSADRINTIGHGKEKPLCTADNEQCWQRNRSDHAAFKR
jgi:peptidoglycan-associated lipoprotein